MERIVVLDGYVANAGDLSWEPLEKLGSFTVYERTTADKVIERAADATAIIINKVTITADLMDGMPNLRYIGLLATGFNNVDIEAARQRGITVTNVPAYSTDSVAQNIFAHLLNITNRIALHADSVRRGEWTRCNDFSYRLITIEQLAGLTMGIYALGHIGMKVAEIARAFGMEVIAYTSKSREQLPDYIEKVDRDELLRRSDVLSLNAPLTPDNRNFINRETLALMKPSAILLNASRGPLIDEDALNEALNDRRIAYAGLDVLAKEPPRSDNPLLSNKYCDITPHIAWQSTAARRRLLEITIGNLSHFLAGNPVNVVN